MIWHTVLLDATNADSGQRLELRRAVHALAEIDEVLWFRDGSEPEDRTIGFLSIFRDAASLDAYRNAPLHLELVRLIRNSAVAVHRLNFDGPPPPA
jgi:hypothetical protein